VQLLALAAETTDALIATAAALSGAIIGSLSTIGATSLGNRHARQEREIAAAKARRERAASMGLAVGDVDAKSERHGVSVRGLLALQPPSWLRLSASTLEALSASRLA
jgi:hypothetical protein